MHIKHSSEDFLEFVLASCFSQKDLKRHINAHDVGTRSFGQPPVVVFIQNERNPKNKMLNDYFSIILMQFKKIFIFIVVFIEEGSKLTEGIVFYTEEKSQTFIVLKLKDQIVEKQ